MPRIYSPTNDQTLARRQAKLASWLSAVQQVALQSKDDEAQAVATFLTEQTCLGIPLPHDRVAYVLPEDGPTDLKACVFMAPILTTDSWRLPPDDYRIRRFAYYGPTGSAAAFHPATRTIYIAGEWPLSKMWSGNLLLHEGLHAYDRIIRRRHMPKPSWRREANAWKLEYRVLCAIGGQRFKDLLDTLVPELKHQFETGKLSWSLTFPEGAAEQTVLDELFGQARDSADLPVRGASARLCAVVRFCEQQYGPDTMEPLRRYVRETMDL